MVSLTDSAAVKLKDIMEEKELEGYALRVFVQGGGCGGMQYGMTFDNQIRDDDQVFEATHGMKVYVDPNSLHYMDGSTVDYLDNLMGGGFHIENPQAVSCSGCGQSSCSAESEAEAESCGTACGHH